jgi:hypothetical protein
MGLLYLYVLRSTYNILHLRYVKPINDMSTEGKHNKKSNDIRKKDHEKNIWSYNQIRRWLLEN